MNNEDYVSYELALKLKACGFDEPCNSYYEKACASDDEYWHTKREKMYNWNGLDSDCQISAPTLAHAQKWMREKKGIVVIAEPDWDSEDYCMSVYLKGEWYFSVWKHGDRVSCNFDPNAEEERIQ